ncbi:hypothetical protein SOASR030_27320 [Leminorella grimontii]|uniref:Uncharacterized protein n=1 Tax=Leminorella grimontii TaxID=82981 RepID=A0AAV5N3T5_9GAMM|nr:hypothetical protein SOASR030_27320 [Leminorella grimontii]
MILDSALFAVGDRTERRILQSLRQWGKGRTLILCTHRLSGLRYANEILVLQEGRIAQQGAYAALVPPAG